MLATAAGPSDVPLIDETIGANLEATVARFPDREALVSPGQGLRLTYAEFDQTVNTVARGLLAAGLNVGDRIGIWSPNNAEWVIVQYATAKIGAILVNINLGILNLLPLPILDGGHIMFSIVELVRGRPVPARIINASQVTFLVVFVSFFLYVTTWDTVRLGQRIRQDRSFEDEIEQMGQEPFEAVEPDAGSGGPPAGAGAGD